MDILFANIWILIPLLAILVGGFSEWLKFKEKQNRLGASAHDLEKTVGEQQAALEAAERRIQNLEAIVTSQVWDALHDGALPEHEKQRAIAEAHFHLAPPEESADTERVAQMARRLKL